MKTNRIVIVLAISACALLVQSAILGAAEHVVLQAAGCKTEYFLLEELAAAYNAMGGAKLQLGSTGNKKAVDLLMDGKIDFAFTCKAIGQLTKGLKLEPESVQDWTSIPIAKDPIVVVANGKNGVAGLTTAQLTEIFQGTITNWKDAGGNDLPIMTSIINPDLQSGVVLLFKEFTVGETGTLDKNAWVADNPSKLGHYVSKTAGAVTFIGFNSYQEKFGTILSIDGVLPTRDNIHNGSYKLAATYYLTISGGDRKDVADFIKFVRSKEGEAVIARNFIPFFQ